MENRLTIEGHFVAHQITPFAETQIVSIELGYSCNAEPPGAFMTLGECKECQENGGDCDSQHPVTKIVIGASDE